MFPIEKNDLLTISNRNKAQKYLEQIVVKILRASGIAQFVGNFEEIILSSNHDHPNILPCLGFNYSKAGNDEYYTYILYPRMKCSLADDIAAKSKQRVFYPLQELISIMTTLLSVHEYLEQKNIAHTNIKPENIFFTHDGEIKVSEIGSRSLYLTTSKDGATISNYAAPELLFNPKANPSELIAGDIWSLGAVFLELACAERLDANFKENSGYIMEERFKVIHNQYGGGIVGLLKMMLNKNPKVRRNFHDCRVYLEELFAEKVEIPIVPNPREAQRYLRENICLKRDLAELEVTLQGKAAWINSVDEEEKRLMRSDSAGPFMSSQSKLNESFYQIYAHFAPYFDEFGHLDLHYKGPDPEINRDGTKDILKDAHKLLSKIQEMKHLIVKARDTQFTLKAGQLLSYLISQIKSLESIELYLTQTELTDQHLIDISLSASSLENLSKCVLALGGTKITELSIKQISRWFLSQPARMEDLELYLWGTQIVDSALDDLASNALSKMANLKSLVISLNNTDIGDKGIASLLTKAICKMKHLRKLELALKELKITDESMSNNITAILNELQCLESLEIGLGGSGIKDGTVRGIAHGLSNLSRIKKLNLYFWSTGITNECLKELGQSLEKNRDIETFLLSLRDTTITDEGIDDLNVCWRTIAFQEFEIYLRNTQIQSPFFSGLISSANSLSKLAIELSESSVYDTVILNLSRDVLNFTRNLKILDIQIWQTFVTDDGIIELSKVIGEQKYLHELILGLGNTKLSDKGIRELNKALSRSKNIQKYDLDFQNTEITFCALTGIASSAPTLRSLKLSFGGTQINDTTFKEFCSAGISKCRHLEKFELYLWGTQLSDVSIKEFASRILQLLSINHIPITERTSFKGYFKKFILSLASTMLSDLAIKELYGRASETLSQLDYMELDVTNTLITESGLQALKSLKNSKKFDIKVSDS